MSLLAARIAFDEIVQGGGIARDFGFEFQTFAHRHDRDAVGGDLSADKNLVAGLRTSRIDVDAFANDSDSGSVDEDFVAFAPINDFGVTGDELHASRIGCIAH